jgi:dynein heavy chain 2
VYDLFFTTTHQNNSPAGTGKTESVKALGHYLGRQTLVFNCDEGIDFQSLGRIFAGLIRSGGWGCFDEFNRLKEDQLSAVSQQIQEIQAALKRRDSTCQLLGNTIPVNSNAAIFVTMNPASKEYGGRSKLPHNLKQLFRDVAMSAPDIVLISQVILRSEGCQYADVIAQKVVDVFELSRQLLSPQRHYDWGLRALKTVLRHAGTLLHHKHNTNNKRTIEEEMSIVINALKVNTLSKLTFADSSRFHALLGDVFPGIMKSQGFEHTDLMNAIKQVCAAMKYEYMESQVVKIIQLYEALNQRMGVVLVGPSCSGMYSYVTSPRTHHLSMYLSMLITSQH